MPLKGTFKVGFPKLPDLDVPAVNIIIGSSPQDRLILFICLQLILSDFQSFI